MDLLGLALHMTSGIIGRVASRSPDRSDGDRIGGVLAAAVGGLLAGQITERSMAAVSISAGNATSDIGAAIASSVGAGVGGATIAVLIMRLTRRLRRD